jgi:hypothetical protein
MKIAVGKVKIIADRLRALDPKAVDLNDYGWLTAIYGRL